MNAPERLIAAAAGVLSLHRRSGEAYEPPLPRPRPLDGTPIAPGALPGQHLILEFHAALALTDAAAIQTALRRAAEAAQATVLALHHHVFTPDGGVTAVAVLAESHISIHTWPEKAYAALDIFMCGACDPLACLPALTATFQPQRVAITCLMRGLDIGTGPA